MPRPISGLVAYGFLGRAANLLACAHKCCYARGSTVPLQMHQPDYAQAPKLAVARTLRKRRRVPCGLGACQHTASTASTINLLAAPGPGTAKNSGASRKATPSSARGSPRGIMVWSSKILSGFLIRQRVPPARGCPNEKDSRTHHFGNSPGNLWCNGRLRGGPDGRHIGTAV